MTLSNPEFIERCLPLHSECWNQKPAARLTKYLLKIVLSSTGIVVMALDESECKLCIVKMQRRLSQSLILW